MRWLVGAVSVLLFATMAATTVGEALDPDPRPGPAAATVTTASSTPTSAASTSPGGTGTTSSSTNGPAPTATIASSPTYTASEVAQHAGTDSCWLIVSGHVYDVTTYLRSHPGGSRTITPWCGRESTVAFATEDGEGEHSDRAYALLEQYRIGELTG